MHLDVRELSSDAEIRDAFPLARELRDRLQPDTFLAEVRRQQVEGYRLHGGFALGRLVALAGVRRTHTLARGEHLFIDDLVTAADSRGKGYGEAMLRHLAAKARDEGLSRIYLDSRDRPGASTPGSASRSEPRFRPTSTSPACWRNPPTPGRATAI
jgi:GNAT superfamily N-acetyltransferase